MDVDEFNIEIRKLPAHCREGISEYVLHGRPIGSFLTAVFSNNFIQAVCRADDDNRDVLIDYARFLYNQCPRDCYGSPEAVAAWIEAGGYRGMLPDMTKPKFKPGDRVRDGADDQIATVVIIDGQHLRLFWDGAEEISGDWWLDDDFELVPAELDPTAGEGEV